MIEQNRDVAKYLATRPVDNGFIHELLFPVARINSSTYVWRATSDTPTIPTEASIKYVPGQVMTPTIRGLETPIAGEVETYGKSSLIPRGQVKEEDMRGELSPRLASEADAIRMEISRFFEYDAKTKVAASTNYTTTTAKWTVATGSTAVIPDLITSFKEFRAAAGVFPNLMFGNNDVVMVLQASLGLLDDPALFGKIFGDTSLEQEYYQLIRGVKLITCTAQYKTSETATTYTDIWSDKRLYLAYVAENVGDKTFKKAYGVSPVYPDKSGDDWTVTQNETKMKEWETIITIDKAQVELDKTCVRIVRGPSGGSYDLV